MSPALLCFDTGEGVSKACFSNVASFQGEHHVPTLACRNLGGRLCGLPAIGFMVYNVINTNAAPGRLANYGAAFAHRTAMTCTGAQNPGDLADSREPCVMATGDRKGQTCRRQS